MATSTLQQLFAERIGGAQFGLKNEIYKFERIKREKREAMLANPGMSIIDLGVGEPDERADDAIIRILEQESRKPENRFYADNGIDAFKEAAAAYMDRVFGVSGLDPDTEINHAIGSKSALAILPAAFINPGDITLMPSPCYPVLGTHTKYYGGEVVHLPLHMERSFLPDLSAIEPDVLHRAKLLYLNYPNNPTGAMATRSFFEEVVRFAKQHQLVVVHDAAYAALVFDQAKPLSFLSVPGAKEVGVELHSLSKSFNMTGWRIGFIAGNAQLVNAFKTIKDNVDSGQFIPIQMAAAYALQHPEMTQHIAAKYSRRHDALTRLLQDYGFHAVKPGGSFFLYVRIPSAVEGGPVFTSAGAFSSYLLKEHLISTVPWDDTGAYVRFSVTYEAATAQDEQHIMDEIRRRLGTTRFIF